LTDLAQHNVLISQGWCAALGYHVPTPHFLKELLGGMFDDEHLRQAHAGALVRILSGAEVTERDRSFHDDVMGGIGNWWEAEEHRDFSFDELWALLQLKVIEVCTAGSY
jgi:hypothetical protein